MLITENWQTQFSFPKIGSNFWTTWFGLITPHWKTIKLLLSNMCLITSHVIFFQQFLIDFRKNIPWGIIQLHSTLLDVFGILIGHQWFISMQISQKTKKWGVNHVQRISGSKITGKMFFSKNLNNHQENMLTSAKNEW